MSSEIIIRAEGLSKAYRIYRKPEDRLKQMIWRRRHFFTEYWALQDVSLALRRGESIGLIGRNGSGKSTLLHLICGTLAPTAGRVEVTGRVAALLELGSGFNPEFTGRENVYLSASILGLGRAEIDARYDRIADFAGIGDFIDQPVKVYSSGMYARLAFAVAAHVDADILIVDEILAVGDAAFAQKCMRFIRRFRENGTLLFVSHDTAAVQALCDKAVWLDRGLVRMIGAAKDVAYHYLESLYQEEADSFSIGGSRTPPARAERPVKDARAELLRESDKRTVLEIFDFNPDAPWFGVQGATIADVELCDADDRRLAALEGGEEVAIVIRAHAHRPLSAPIIGFIVKDRLGQPLFGDNTYLTYRHAPLAVPPGAGVQASFRFQMPYLPAGDYAVTAAIAEGTQAEHTQHHWIDEALIFRVHSSHVARGLIGIPMLSIDLALDDPAWNESSQPATPA